jgi:hypothetical protein
MVNVDRPHNLVPDRRSGRSQDHKESLGLKKVFRAQVDDTIRAGRIADSYRRGALFTRLSAGAIFSLDAPDKTG